MGASRDANAKEYRVILNVFGAGNVLADIREADTGFHVADVQFSPAAVTRIVGAGERFGAKFNPVAQRALSAEAIKAFQSSRFYVEA